MSSTVGVDLRTPARNFGFGLIAMGVALITIGLFDHRRRFAELKLQMDDLHERKLLLEPCPPNRSPVARPCGLPSPVGYIGHDRGRDPRRTVRLIVIAASI